MILNQVLFVLSVAGFLAALRRLLFAAFQLLRGGVDSFVMREVASVRAAQGDLTGLQEARAQRRAVRRKRSRALHAVLFWLALVVVPFLTRATTEIYASYCLLWLIPLSRTQSRT